MPTSVSVDLYLLRHGIAAERVQGADDPERALTRVGQQRALAVMRRLRSLGFQADRLLTSPYRRARQTAELAVQADLAPQLELEPRLQPGGDHRALVTELGGRCLLVGHEPDLSDLAAALLGAPAGSLRLRKAGLCHLHWSRPSVHSFGTARLEALLRPRFLLPGPV